MQAKQTTAKIAQRRTAGVLLPVSSLPSAYGIGGFGPAAYQWVDFLQQAGQSYWQLLPLGPTSFGDSPYQSFSAFAGNPYFVDLDRLREDGLLTEAECNAAVVWNTGSVDYAALFKTREPILRKAFSRFSGRAALDAFVEKNNHWLPDYALFMAAKARMGHRSWLEWGDEGLRMREPAALARWRGELQEDIAYHYFVQYQFHRQWEALHSYANARGVSIIGDIPIYVSLDSADVWAGPQWFELDAGHLPTEVAGVPPDGFSQDGQLWGNPLYRWQAMGQDGYSWWIRRMRACFEMYDVLRIDHFRGLESFYAIPYGSTTAARGRWRKGPGMAFIQAIKNALPNADIIAEDLGFLTDGVRALLAGSGFPGMKVLQFAFDPREESDYRPHMYGPGCVAYTGTHDNDTVLGWAQEAPAEAVEYAIEYLGVKNKQELPAAFIRGVYQSAAALVIVPLQDWMELGADARINIPSTLGGSNWRWRMRQPADSALAKRMCRMAKIYGRVEQEIATEDTVA